MPVASAEQLPEIVATGFQEIVELSPQQIMNSDPTRKQQWETVVRNTLNKHAASLGGEQYVLLRSGQLVGAALCIFVKASSLAKIKNVEGSVKKTGMSGMAGNKGAVSIRLDYANTPICFVTAHLAAGFANYEERNRDYLTIHHGLRFQRNRGIDDHDAVMWFGDFNYRIGLGRDRALDLVHAHNLEALYENDQLNLQMVAGLAFPYYSEARITFPPTYKFDIGRDDYDSSEKQRIPAWTDRILRKGPQLRQTEYNSAPLRFSDHRPVYAHLNCTVNIVDEVLRDKISRELYERRKGEVGDLTANTMAEDTDDEDLLGYDAIEPGLPAASSDQQKWWLDNGRMAQATVQPPVPASPSTHIAVLNPKRPPNPFTPTDEPDWVAVPRTESRLSSFSSLSTSPYEHISHPSHMSTSAASSQGGGIAASRKQYAAPHHDASASATPPPPPPARRQTAAAHNSRGDFGHGDDMPPTLSKKTASTTSLPSAGTPPANARMAPTVSAVAKASDELRTSASSSPGSSSLSAALNRGSGDQAPPLPVRQPSQKLAPGGSGGMGSSVTPPRPASVASFVSNSTAASALSKGKVSAPPPVAKKPAHLASVALQSDAGANSATPPPKPPRRHTGLAPAAANEAAPRLPVRTSTVVGGHNGRPVPMRPGKVDLLDDDTDSELSRWQALQPS